MPQSPPFGGQAKATSSGGGRLHGVVPETVQIAWYTLDESSMSISIDSMTTHRGDEFYAADHGFESADIETPEQLAQILEKIDNLIEITMSDDLLQISGRRYRNDTFKRKYRRVDECDVRVLHRAYFDLAKDPAVLRNALAKQHAVVEVLEDKELIANLLKASEEERTEHFEDSVELILTSELPRWKMVRQQIDAQVDRTTTLVFSLDPWVNPGKLSLELQDFLLDFEEDDLPDGMFSEIENVIENLETKQPYPAATDAALLSSPDRGGRILPNCTMVLYPMDGRLLVQIFTAVGDDCRRIWYAERAPESVPSSIKK